MQSLPFVADTPYFSLPASHTGRQLSSYGGYLRYNLLPPIETGRREPSVVITVSGRTETRRDETRRDETRRRTETRRDETRRDETRRDETGRDETRNETKRDETTDRDEMRRDERD